MYFVIDLQFLSRLSQRLLPLKFPIAGSRLSR
jgi:hypothetical protein